MTFFSSIAVASLLVSPSLLVVGGAATATGSATRTVGGDRHLNRNEVLGYEFEYSMDDHLRIDQDQLAIEVALAEKNSESFDDALTIYEEGGHSKSYARLKLKADGGLPEQIKKGTSIQGKTADGTTIQAKAYEQAEVGDAHIEVHYPTKEGSAPCFVGALK